MAKSPNPRLQRTRSAPLRSPLSRKPLGGRLGASLLMAGLAAAGLLSCSSGRPPCRNVIAPVLVSGVGLRPPEGFWKSHPDGKVEAYARIGEAGRVTSVRILKSPGDDYSTVALESVRQWRYEPAMCDGKPVATDLTVTIRFAHDAKPEQRPAA